MDEKKRIKILVVITVILVIIAIFFAIFADDSEKVSLDSGLGGQSPAGTGNVVISIGESNVEDRGNSLGDLA
ncbi:hypothetical protein HN604_02220 [archaeon]|jgi:hypothetical protein|nr:hypothetical protein [archaeon]MBT6182876.1 hypothetical protein [archaeon]MBT6606257.1 hypothetical protein [archaeon]MBT7251574.1 hypothetical protein [archaeon]MBT7660877.1 hypothetical protein [archaeon]